MLIPRYNNFSMLLPHNMLPKFLLDLYTDILRDADLLKNYPNGPSDALAESILGIDVPGIHVKLIEQQENDLQGTGSVTRLWPKGQNAMRMLDDNEMALTFRHIDGFLTYYMMRDAIKYMSDDNAQTAQGETFKKLGNLCLSNTMSPKYSRNTIFQGAIYSGIDGNKFSYSAMASENTFTVRCKFLYAYDEVYYDGKCISKQSYNHHLGN
jgi:hypothetical protein